MKLVGDSLVTPIVFLYPEFAQFDYVEEASEDVTLWGIFSEIFAAGLPWDQRGDYKEEKQLRFYVAVRHHFVEAYRQTEPRA